MGFARDELGRYAGAIEAYEKVVAIDPKSKLAILARSHIHTLGKED